MLLIQKCAIGLLFFSYATMFTGMQSPPIRRDVPSLGEQCLRVLSRAPDFEDTTWPLLKNLGNCSDLQNKAQVFRINHALLRHLPMRTLYKPGSDFSTLNNGKLAEGFYGRGLRVSDFASKRYVWSNSTIPINSLAFDDAGANIVSAGDDGVIRIWQADTGECLKEFPNQGEKIFTVAFSLDNKKIISGGVSGELCIWDAQTGICEHTIQCKGAIFSVTCSPDKLRCAVLCCSHDPSVYMYNISSGELECVLSDPNDRVLKEYWVGRLKPSFHPSGKQLALCAVDGAVRIWRIPERRCDIVQLSECDFRGAAPVAFDPSGTRIVSGEYLSDIGIWNLATGAKEKKMGEGFGGGLYCLEYSNDGTCVIASGVRSAIFGDYCRDIQSIDTVGELQLLACAAEDWLKDRSHPIDMGHPALGKLRSSCPYLFPYKNKDKFFTPLVGPLELERRKAEIFGKLSDGRLELDDYYLESVVLSYRYYCRSLNDGGIQKTGSEMYGDFMQCLAPESIAAKVLNQFKDLLEYVPAHDDSPHSILICIKDIKSLEKKAKEPNDYNEMQSYIFYAYDLYYDCLSKYMVHSVASETTSPEARIFESFLRFFEPEGFAWDVLIQARQELVSNYAEGRERRKSQAKEATAASSVPVISSDSDIMPLQSGASSSESSTYHQDSSPLHAAQSEAAIEDNNSGMQNLQQELQTNVHIWRRYMPAVAVCALGVGIAAYGMYKFGLVEKMAAWLCS